MTTITERLVEIDHELKELESPDGFLTNLRYNGSGEVDSLSVDISNQHIAELEGEKRGLEAVRG